MDFVARPVFKDETARWKKSQMGNEKTFGERGKQNNRLIDTFILLLGSF